MTMRSACGSTILRVILPCVMPSDMAASVWPLGTALTPARKTSARTPDAASATGIVIIQNDGILRPYLGMTRKKK